jgi:hypothetical protein
MAFPSDQLLPMLRLAHEALARVDQEHLVQHADLEELVALFVALARITGWQAELILSASRVLDERRLAELHAMVCAACQEEARARAALAAMTPAGRA